MFPGPVVPWGFYGAEWDEHLCSLCTFQPFLIVHQSLGRPPPPGTQYPNKVKNT